MRLRYRPPADAFAAASARSEAAFSAACLPRPELSGGSDARSEASAAGGACLARQLLDAAAPQRCETEVVVDSRPQAAFQSAMAKARQLLRPRVNAVGRLLCGDWWGASGVDAALPESEQVEPAPEPTVAFHKLPIDLPVAPGSPLDSGSIDVPTVPHVSSLHVADAAAGGGLRASAEAQPRHSDTALPAEGALMAAVAEACGESGAGDGAAFVIDAPMALSDAEPAAASLMLALLSEAAVAAAAAPPDSPARVEREAAAADEHTRSCALLRAMSHGAAAGIDAMEVDGAMPPAMPDPEASAEPETCRATTTASDSDDADFSVAMLETPATRPDEGVATDAALRAFAAEQRRAHSAAEVGPSPGDEPLPPPPALGARGACEPRLLHAALLHSLLLAPALAPPAAHVPSLPPPFVAPDASAPTAAALALAAARAGGAAAAPGAAARAELALPWGADAAALAPARRAKQQAALLPQRLPPPGEAAQRTPPRSIAQLLDAEPDAQPAPEPEAAVAPPAPVPRRAEPLPASAPPPRAGGGLGAAPGRDADDVARFARAPQGGAGGFTPTAEPLPPPQLHCWELPAAPHGAAWRALRSAAAGVAARELARHDPRDAAALSDPSAADDDPFWAGGPDLGALRQRIRAVSVRAPAHARALAACYALHAAAQTLALCGMRAAAAYLEAATRAVPAIAEQPTAGAMAAARAALAAAAAAAATPSEDHPPTAATLRAAMLAAAGGKLALVADARGAPGAAAALAASGVRAGVLEHEGPFETAACSGDAAGAAAALRAAAAGCDALLMTHAQAAAAAAHAGGALRELFAAAALLSPPPPGPAAAAVAALLTSPGRAFAGAAHVCVVRPPRDVTAPPPAPRHRPQPPIAPVQPPIAAPPPQAAPVAACRPVYGGDDDDDGGFASGLVALGARSGVLRSWPALRDAILRLEGRRGASVATRELGLPGEAGAAACAAAQLLRAPDTLALGPSGAVVALRVLRGGADGAMLAAAAGIEARSLADECATLAARVDALALVVIAAPDAARAAAQHATALAAAAAAAALPLRLVVAADDAAGRDAVLSALDWALDAPPGSAQNGAASALRSLPDAAPPGEALLRCCGGFSALAAHALLCSGVPLAALLRADLTDAAAVAAAAARGGVALSAEALRAFDDFRAALLGAPPQEAPPEAPPAPAAWQHRAPGPAPPQPWEAAQAAAAREAWRAAPSPPPGGWREARAAASQQQQHRAPVPAPAPRSPSPCLDDDDVALLFDEPPLAAAWALPAMPARSAAHLHLQPASSAAMGRASAPAPAGYHQHAAGYDDGGGGGGASVRGMLDDWLKTRRGGGGVAPPQQPRVPAAVAGGFASRSAASSSSSDGSDDMRGFLRGLDAAPPAAAAPPPARPQWRAVAAPAASGCAPPQPRPRAAPPPPMLDAFRCAPPRGATPPPMAAEGGGYVFAPRGGAAKRLRFTDAPSPAGSAAAGASMPSLGGVRFAPSVQLPRGPAPGASRALAAPSAPLPLPPPPAAALRATPEAKQKLQELLQKMDARRGRGPRAARRL